MQQGFLCKEGLVGSDEDVGEGEETGEFVVLEDFAGKVLEKDTFLFFVDIKCYPSDVSGFQALNEGGSINELAAAGIEYDGARLELREGFYVEKVVGIRKKRNVEGQNVAGVEEFLKVDVLDVIGFCPFRRGEWIVG